MRWSLPVLILLLMSCGSVRKQMERATLYEREGMYTEAFSAYETIREKRPKEAEAHVGMKRTAQMLLDRKIMEASERYLANDLEQGERLRSEAVLLKQGMDQKGLELQWDGHLDDLRRTARSTRAKDLLRKAEEAFRTDHFNEAEELASSCQRLDPELKEADYLVLIAQLEPRYREGQKAETLGSWRDAHKAYRWITMKDPGYKDAWQRLRTAKENASYTLAYVPLFNTMLYTAQFDMGGGMIEQQLSANLKQAILDLDDPLIILVDRDNTGELLAEQQRNMSGIYQDRYVAEAGKLIGARYVLTGRIMRFDDVLSKQIEVQMQVLDAESGRILLADVVRVNKQDIGKGAPRAQLLERAAKRMAARLSEFTPGDR
ncbi:MAG: hypothetical protein JNL43_02400 [Flavobacteriales bacterium]|nr:hypothetical protein [Flavobacteriales bacterium]